MLKHSTLIKIFIISGVIIFSIIVWLVIANSNYIFSLKKFYITGNSYISFDEILNLSGLKYSEPLVNIDSARIEQELKINPFIENIVVKVLFPDSIKIDITERRPFAFLEINNKGYILDKNALILKETNKIYENFDFLRIKLLGLDNVKYLVGDKVTIDEIYNLLKNLVVIDEIYKILSEIENITLNVNKDNVYLKFRKLKTIFDFPDGLKEIEDRMKKAVLVYEELIRKNKKNIDSIIISDIIIGKY